MNSIVKFMWKTFAGLAPVTATRIAYYKAKHKMINLKTPELFDEKLSYLKLYDYANNPLVIQCADKYAVREYVKNKGCEDSLNELFGVWDRVEDIPFDTFPDAFVLKCTHGCHMNIVCPDKGGFDREQAKLLLSKWMKEKQWKEQQEIHYKHIVPRIICERYLRPTSQATLPLDYKIYCFNGEPKLVLIISDREHEMELTFRDLDWNLMEIGNRNNNLSIPKPTCFDKMIEYSRALSGDFPFVRIDFYNYEGKAVFGEMTFSPAGSNADYYTEQGQIMLGKLLNL